MNYAEELSKLIEIASRRTDFQTVGYRSFEQEHQRKLNEALKSSNLFFTTSVLGMEAISHVIEDQAINTGGKFNFYSGFQKFSRLKPQEERYRKLSRLGNPINIFGVPDIEIWNYPNLKVVNLVSPRAPEEYNLAHNWFVVLNNPQFVSMALVASELPRPKLAVRNPDKLVYRNFEGFWTYNQLVINEVVNILDSYINSGK
jgi:DICT domain-containing protein